MDQPEIADHATHLLGLFGTGRSAPRLPGLSLSGAQAIRRKMRALREDRGDPAVGRKIGFTNTTILASYGVSGPLWNHVHGSTLHPLDRDSTAPAARFAEPRIEPEIVFRLARPPAPGMDAAALLACIDAVAHGFEIVQSVFPGWQFTAAEATAAYGLHGALFTGPWHRVDDDPARWRAALDTFSLALSRDGTPVDAGHARNVLGGPLHALARLVADLAADRDSPPLAAGEIVTTGTLTDAHPIRAGDVWTTTLTGLPLPGLTLRIG